MSPYQYVVLRCVPRVEREEFINVGVVLFCPDQDFLAAASRVDPARLTALAPQTDPRRVEEALASVDLICRGEAHANLGSGVRATAYGERALIDSLSSRFGLLKAPRSTVLQPGPVHGGLTADAAAELARLLEVFVPQTGTSASEPTA